MTFPQSQTFHVVVVAAAGVAALALTGCNRPAQQAATDPAAPSATASTQASGAGLVVAAPTEVKPPPAGVAIPPIPIAAAEATADNAKVAEMAKQFEADPAATARQNDICGPADQVLDGLYAQSHGVQTDELRRFRVACMAKDVAQREAAKHAAGAEGVHNNGSL